MSNLLARSSSPLTVFSLAIFIAAGPALATTEPAQLVGLGSWDTQPVFTVGETIGSYTPPGLLDGQGALAVDASTVRIFVNHELAENRGYLYALGNGTSLTGGRVSFFDFDVATRDLLGAGLAYDTIVDRKGDVVTSGAQINEGTNPTNGVNRLCSAQMGLAGEFGLVDDVFFTGEETSNGQEFALDARGGVLYCAPAMGRAAFEAVALITPPSVGRVAILIGDDRAPAPLLLYVGDKDALGDESFLDRNGLASGTLYAWVSGDGFLNPGDFRGTGNVATGTFVPIDYFDPLLAGTPGYDDLGYANQTTQDAAITAAGGFFFSRPEDVHTNPDNALQSVFSSTGRSALNAGVDSWGTTYIIDVTYDVDTIRADLTIAYDGDDAGGGQFAGPDWGLRSPDNLTWAGDGKIYVQEDRAFNLFGTISGEEASIWELNPPTGNLLRVAQVDRSAIPSGQFDNDPNDLGDWETSGIIDVTDSFETDASQRLLFCTVQAHSLRGGVITNATLEQGGQLTFLSRNTIVAVDDDALLDPPTPDAELPLLTVLKQNAPNPFNPSTVIGLALPRAGQVALTIFDASGRRVAKLVDGPLEAGPHRFLWRGRDDAGRLVASGTYYYELRTANRRLGKTMTLAK